MDIYSYRALLDYKPFPKKKRGVIYYQLRETFTESKLAKKMPSVESILQKKKEKKVQKNLIFLHPTMLHMHEFILTFCLHSTPIPCPGNQKEQHARPKR